MSVTYESERALLLDCSQRWPGLLIKIKAALDDTGVPSGSELKDLKEFQSAAYAVTETNQARVAAVVVENALRSLYLYATGKEVIPVDPSEQDVFDADFPLDLLRGKINKAVIAYKVLFVEKPDQRFLSIAGAEACYAAQRSALVDWLTNQDITIVHAVDSSKLEAWFGGLKPSDTLFEKMRGAALESITPPFMFQFGDSATKVLADYAGEVSTELVIQAKGLMACPRCVLEVVDHELNQLCGVDFVKHFVCFENRPKAALLSIKKHRENAKERHPPLCIFMNDGTLYVMHLAMKLFEHHDIFKGLTRWMELMQGKAILGTKFIDSLYDEINNA